MHPEKTNGMKQVRKGEKERKTVREQEPIQRRHGMLNEGEKDAYREGKGGEQPTGNKAGRCLLKWKRRS